MARRSDAGEQIRTPDGTLALAFGDDYAPLGFSLKLLAFHRGLNPGGMGDASLASTVRLRDKSRDVDEDRMIFMNHPLVHDKSLFGRFVVHQLDHQETADGKAISIFGVAYDPGWFLKYAGSAMICVGALGMFFRKARRFRTSPLAGPYRSSDS